MENVAKDPAYETAKAELAAQLQEYLRSTKSSREVGGAKNWEKVKYFAERDLTPEPSPEAIEATIMG